MALSMQHWNGCQMCAIDTETTGLDPLIHEIVQIAIVPLDSNLNVRQDIVPFYTLIKPQNPKTWDAEAKKKTGLNMEAIKMGHDPFKAADLLESWLDKLNLPFNKSGYNRCKILPLGYNYQFDLKFIIKWLGEELYKEWFDHQYRDPMIVANYLNDQAGMHAERVPFSKRTLSWVANQYKVENPHAHNALGDAVTTAAVYKKMISQGMRI